MGIEIEVVYALPDEQVVIPVNVEPAATIEDAIRLSGILERFPEIVLEDRMVGIFGHCMALDHPVQAHDRVEIYRPLHASPADARRMRAEARRRRRRAGK